jgi:hypothetical protein
MATNALHGRSAEVGLTHPPCEPQSASGLKPSPVASDWRVCQGQRGSRLGLLAAAASRALRQVLAILS